MIVESQRRRGMLGLEAGKCSKAEEFTNICVSKQWVNRVKSLEMTLKLKSSMTSKNHLQATRSRAEKSVDDTLLLHGIDLQ